MVVSWTVDSDYDGRSDAQEIIDGTDPFNPNSVLSVRLGYFQFDNTNTWAGSAGQLPLVANNVAGVASWSTNGALIDSPKAAILKYRDVETNGNANINLRNGTVRFWFRPDWSSANAGGGGPGGYARLIEVGSNNPAFGNSWTVGSTNGWWALFLNTNGTQLAFGSSTNGGGLVDLSAGISWLSNQWHQIVLTYTPTNSLLYLDGQLAANGMAFVLAVTKMARIRPGVPLTNWKPSIIRWPPVTSRPIIKRRSSGIVWGLACRISGRSIPLGIWA